MYAPAVCAPVSPPYVFVTIRRQYCAVPLTPTAALDVGLGAADVTFYNLTWAIFLARRVRAFGRPMLAEYTVLDIFVGEAQLPELANGGDDAHDLR